MGGLFKKEEAGQAAASDAAVTTAEPPATASEAAPPAPTPEAPSSGAPTPSAAASAPAEPAAPARPAVAEAPVQEMPGGGFALGGHAKGCKGLAFSGDSEVLAIATNDTKLYLWNPTHRKLERVLENLDVIAFSPGGRYLASRTEGLTVLDTATGKELWTMPGEQLVKGHRGWWRILSASFSPGDEFLALSLMASARPSGEPAEQTIVVYQVKDAEQKQLAGQAGAAVLGFSPDGLKLALRPAGQTQTAVVVDIQSEAELHRVETDSEIRCAVFASDTRVLLGCDGLTAWDLQSNALTATVSGSGVENIELPPSGQGPLVTGEQHGWVLRDQASLAPLKEIALSQLPQQQRGEGKMMVSTLSPDGKWLAAAEVSPPWALGFADEQPVYFWIMSELM